MRFRGGLLIAPFSVLAGAFAGNKQATTFVADLKDSDAFVATSDEATFAQFKSAAFRNGHSR